MKIGKIIQKDLKILLRSKMSAMIVILGPLALILLVGTAFNNASTYRVEIGHYAPQYTDLTNSFLKKLADKQYGTTEFSSEEECVQAIMQGAVHTCISFPGDLSIENNKSNNIVFHVDYSKINLVYMVMDTLTAGVSERSSEITTNLTQVLLQKLTNTQNELKNQESTVIDLTDENVLLTSKSTSITNGLSALDLGMDLGAFKVSTISDSTKSIVDRVKALRGTASSQIIEIQTKHASAKSKVEALDANATKEDEIQDIIDDATTELSTLSTSISTVKTQTENDWDEVSGLLSNVESNLNSIKGKLDRAGTFKASSLTELAIIKSTLAESLNNIVSMKQAMNSINTDIASIQVTNVKNIVNPITTTIKPVISEKTHLNYLFPGLIVLVVMFTAILLSTTIVMTEKKSPAFFRNYVTPTKDITFFFASFITNFNMMVMQLIIIISIAIFYFKTEFTAASLASTGVILLLVVMFFILLGMGIGYLFNSEQTATLGSLSVGTIFLFLSGLILPLESMPEYASQIANYNPFVIATNLLRRTILFQSSLNPLRGELYYLIGYSLGLFILIIILQRVMRRLYLHKIMGRFIHNRRARKEKKRKEKELKPKNAKDEEHVLSL